MYEAVISTQILIDTRHLHDNLIQLAISRRHFVICLGGGKGNF